MLQETTKMKTSALFLTSMLIGFSAWKFLVSTTTNDYNGLVVGMGLSLMAYGVLWWMLELYLAIKHKQKIGG